MNSTLIATVAQPPPTEPSIVFSSQITLGSLLTILVSLGAIFGAVVRITSKLTEFKYNLEKQISLVEQQVDSKFNTLDKDLLRVHQKFEMALASIEASQELLEKEQKTQSLEYVNLQKEVQRLLRDFDHRLQDLEQCAVSSGYKIRRPKFNEDIESL